ncbi:MAG TPA: hypothetical protein VNJ05_01775 [Sphingomicrobium sp.]|nr:hypothetical protein [Sphingomicrobium sp.]
MKTMILGAIALAVAIPAAAQTAPVSDKPAQHAMHEEGKHDCKKCCEKMMKEHHHKMDHSKQGDAASKDHQDHSKQ